MYRNKKNSLYFYIIVGFCLAGMLALLISYIVPSQTIHKHVTNNVVNNEITNKVVKYDELTIEDVDTAIQTASDKVSAAVIGVTTRVVVKSGTGKFVKDTEGNYSVASGVIYRRDEIKDASGKLVNYEYYVITNRHVVCADDIDPATLVKTNIYAYLGDTDEEIPAEVLGYDKKVDIALIKFQSSRFIEPVTIADSDDLIKGQLAIAVGNPDGYTYYGSVTFGVISSPERYISSDTDGDGTDDFYAEYIQHDVAINPGNSGGGLFNLKGELVGINTLKLVDSTIDNMGFAIPSNVVMTIIKEYLEQGKEIVRPRLGVLGTEVRSLTEAIIENSEDIIDIPDIYQGEQPYGIYVIETYEGTTIGETSIEKDDIILQMNDIKLTRMYIVNSKLNSLITGFKVGETISVTYFDRSENVIKTIDVVLKAE